MIYMSIYFIEEMFAERHCLFDHPPRDVQATDTTMEDEPAW